ncbi:VOC family protein [Pedobacter sp. MC2016-14]|uniref:VOC family protein n=1 Tax=Pedobacter sp. MC2016-14 TaxID=2897327 RepID=UPI001E3F77FB|nr:VOC family protein [Pedobacter sp. MC2016-14]MCD0489880.1 VOC family protein [Pedobacter sp. MC2016-14]
MKKYQITESLKNQTKKAATVVIGTLIAIGTNSHAKAQSKAAILGIDHVGINVPDLNQAISFFDNVLGFSPVTTLGPIPLDDAWKKGNHMNSKTGAVTIRMLNAGSGASIEIFSYENNHGSQTIPDGDDIGATHIAFYTSNIREAVVYLKSKGIKVLGEPYLTPSGDTAGESWVYFLSPWGSKFELVSYPDGKAYEKNKPEKLLWSPKQKAKDEAGASGTLNPSDLKSLVEKHLNLWNENQMLIRKQIMEQIYADNIEMVDRNFIARGYQEVDQFITGLQVKNPEFKFSIRNTIDVHQNVARLYWQVGSKTQPSTVTGMDLFVVENGKIQKLYVFVDSK